MAPRSRLMASAAVGGLMLLGTAATSSAQHLAGSPATLAAFAPGSIYGIVRDEKGAPVAGALVSAVGRTTAVAMTKRDGRFELLTLSPGPYLVRAHLSGYVAPRAQAIEVRPNLRSASSIALRSSGASYPVLAAGVGASADSAPPQVEPGDDAAGNGNGNGNDNDNDDHGETLWRLRHARRGILKDVEILIEDEALANNFTPAAVLGRAVGSPARLATTFFVDTPFSGQVNLLTSGSFDTPQQLFASDNFSRGIAYIRLGAPVGTGADWTVRGAVNHADISSWILAGSYATRASERHRYDVGMSYSTQRYDGGNPLALRDVTDGSRNAGALYGFDTFTMTPALTLTYGSRYARYDYLESRDLLSPRAEITMTPARHLRVNAQISRRTHAPGAEEFLPPADTGIWLPPQRTFSSIEPGRRFEAERATHVAVEVEHDVAGSTITIGAFRQHVDDQLVTLFGADMPQQPSAKLGHYFVGNAGDVDAAGCTAAFRTTLASRVSGSVAYSMMRAELTPADDLRYLVLLAPSATRPGTERIHDVSTAIEANVPETSTRVLVFYRMSNAFAVPASRSDASNAPGVDSRFDVQVRQSLPFLGFTSAKWEMLVAVRNFFRERVDHQSVYDELLVVSPPKRIVGGVTMWF